MRATEFLWGVLLSCLLVSQAGLFEVLRFRAGGYDVAWRDFVAFVAAYALFGLGVSAVGAVALATLTAIRKMLGRGGWNRGLVLWLLPSWSLGALITVYLNKVYLPPVTSPGTVAANLGLVVVSTVIAVLLGRAQTLVRLAPIAAAMLLLSNVAVGGALKLMVGERHPSLEDAEVLDDGPLIVIALVDTLRPDHLGVYGYPKDTSPSLDEWSADAAVFEAAYSPSNWTRPAVASLMTSTLPTRHGVNDFDLALPRALELLTETLQGAGYSTAVFSANPNVEAEDGYERGTDLLVQFSHRGMIGRIFLLHDVLAKDLPQLERLIRAMLGWRDGDSYTPAALTDRALVWMEEQVGAAFAYLHYAGPHDPYLPPQQFLDALGERRLDRGAARPPAAWAGREALADDERRQLIGQYDGEILWHDRELGRLFDFLGRRSRHQDVVLFVTSDHGEGFGENGVWAHGAALFDEIVRIPLLVWCSPACAEPRSLQTPVSLIDISPTVLEMAGLEPPESYEGASLVQLLSGQGDRSGGPIISVNPKNGEGSIRTSVWGLAFESSDRRNREWLWRLGGDRMVRGGDEDSREIRGRLRAEFESAVSASAEAAANATALELDDRRRSELKALGYLD